MALVSAGCSQNVQVQTTFPEPLVEPLPVTVGVHYNEALTSYSYSEELPADSMDWNFSIGAANKLLFKSIFDEVFTTTIPVSTNAADGVTAVLEPNIEAFEFSLPRHSGSKQYGVWIKYSVNVYGPDGQLRVNWPVKGYGEVDSRRFKGNQTMRQATVLAMRDAAVIIIESLNRDTAFRRAVLGDTVAPERKADAENAINNVNALDEPASEVGRVEDEIPALTGEEQNGES